jgi:predicted dehydrogenase
LGKPLWIQFGKTIIRMINHIPNHNLKGGITDTQMGGLPLFYLHYIHYITPASHIFQFPPLSVQVDYLDTDQLSHGGKKKRRFSK